MHFSAVLSLAALSATAFASPAPNPNPQITATPQPSQSAAIASAIQGLILDLGIEDSNQIASVTKAIANAGPAVQSAVAAALPNQATQNYGAFETAVNNIITGSPTGFGALPTDVQAFVKSVASQEASIFNNGGSTPTSNGAGQQVPCRWDIGVWAGGLVAALVGTILA